MSDRTNERVEGKIDEVKGHAKSAWGDISGDERTRAEGEIDKAKGKMKQGMADAKDRVEDAVRDLTDR
jgi:uncharacterized protein YjbJ (UPF0337 family)